MNTTKQDFYTRAVRVFGTRTDEPGLPEVDYPYDVDSGQVNRALRRSDPDLYQQQWDELNDRRRLIVEWAERYGLKQSHKGCCPRWLLGTKSLSCLGKWRPWSQQPECTYTADSGWLDHKVAWLKDGVPVALTSAPYAVSDDDRKRVAEWLARDDRLRVAYGTGWYGYGTSQVILWRADRVENLAPAEPVMIITAIRR